MDLYSRAKADHTKEMEKEIINAITTNETLFFRDASPFEVFKHKIIPDLVDARAKRGVRPIPIRIWSAACSTGQEVYSIAISLREALDNLSNYNISILGTDISDNALSKAALGHFNKFEIERGLPTQTLHRYFTPVQNGWKIRDEIKKMATFRKFNLMKPFIGLGKFDIVFCRNVAIYFTPADKKAVFEKIAGVLEPDGALIIGSTESLTGVTNMYEPKRYLRSIFYQPVTAGAPSSAAGEAPAYSPVPSAPSRPFTATPRPAAPIQRPAPAASYSTTPSAPPRPATVTPPPPRPEPVRIVNPEPVPKFSEQPAAEPVVNQPKPPPPAPRPPVFQPAPPPVVGDKSALKRKLMEKKKRLKK
jgi:chemotaxis protein methyltransferase CheR